ncbi:MAG: 2-oxoisovalerate dehydrogenase E1 component, partial [Myxococcota bacterium]
MATTEQDVETALTGDPQGPWDVTDAELLRWYRTMVTSRRIDDREMALKRQNKIFFQISGAGHEGIQVALAPHLRSGSDWFFLYYRDRSLALELGQTPLDHFLQGVGAAADPNGGGRQMPSHFSDPRYNIANTSSPTGTQFLQAVGAAEFVHRVRRIEEAQAIVGVPAPDEIVVVCGGDGTTSEGEFFEAISSACTLSLPVLFLIEDNGYAISVPVEVQTPGGSISKVVSGFPGLEIFECDGCDVLESHRVSGQAVRHVRSGKGPALLHAHVTRPYSHSMSDDERTYRTTAERDADAARDPLVLTRALVIARGAATDEQLEALERQIEAEVAAAADEALTYPQPAPETAMRHLFSEEVDPTGPAF